MGARGRAQFLPWFGAPFAPNRFARTVGVAWGFSRTPGCSRACRKLLKIERLELPRGVDQVPFFFGRQATGQKRESVCVIWLGFAWRNDGTCPVRIASNHQVFGKEESKATAQ